jgi:hypothetical protein
MTVSDTRIYRVTRTEGLGEVADERLVKATNRTAALRHVIDTTHHVEVASQTDLVRLLSEGVPVEVPAADKQLSLVD